jgi:hypothetical protein
MKLSTDVIIPDEKINQYLLLYREQDDKSKFLAQGGFTQDNSEQLKQAILELIQTEEAIEDSSNQYGIFYRVEGNLKGINRNLAVITIWLERAIDKKIQFITLKPKKEKKS